jgi:hypothetical protein
MSCPLSFHETALLVKAYRAALTPSADHAPPIDPVIFGGAAVVLIATGLAAVSFRRSALLGWIPSLR